MSLEEELRELQRQVAALEARIAEIRALLDAPVDPPVEPPPPPPIIIGPDSDTPIPQNKDDRTVVANGDQLLKLIAKGIKPGGTLALDPGGDFSGTYVIKDPGTYVVGGEGVQTKVPGRFVMLSPWSVVRGVDFSGNGRKVEIWGKGCRVTRSRFVGISYDGIVYLMGGKHGRVMVDRCEFVHFVGAAIRGEIKNISAASDMSFHLNLFRDHSPRGDNESVIAILTDAFNNGRTQFRENLFDSCLQDNNNGQGEIITVKIGGSRLSKNTVINTEGFFSFRETNDSVADENWLGSRAYIKVFGDDHQLINNFGENIVLNINRGDAYATDPVPDRCKRFGKAGRTTLIHDGNRCKVAHCATRRAIVRGNTGRIVLGNKNDKRYGNTHEGQEVRLIDNERGAERIGEWECVKETGIGQAVITAKRLTAADVGIKAA